MTKRITRIEVTKTFNNGETVVTLNGTKMNTQMCETIVKRLISDWKNVSEDKNSDIKEVKFRCVD